MYYGLLCEQHLKMFMSVGKEGATELEGVIGTNCLTTLEVALACPTISSLKMAPCKSPSFDKSPHESNCMFFLLRIDMFVEESFVATLFLALRSCKQKLSSLLSSS